MVQGKQLVPINELSAGDIGAVAKLKEVATGDVLVTGEPAVAFPPRTTHGFFSPRSIMSVRRCALGRIFASSSAA